MKSKSEKILKANKNKRHVTYRKISRRVTVSFLFRNHASKIIIK